MVPDSQIRFVFPFAHFFAYQLTSYWSKCSVLLFIFRSLQKRTRHTSSLVSATIYYVINVSGVGLGRRASKQVVLSWIHLVQPAVPKTPAFETKFKVTFFYFNKFTIHFDPKRCAVINFF